MWNVTSTRCRCPGNSDPIQRLFKTIFVLSRNVNRDARWTLRPASKPSPWAYSNTLVGVTSREIPHLVPKCPQYIPVQQPVILRFAIFTLLTLCNYWSGSIGSFGDAHHVPRFPRLRLSRGRGCASKTEEADLIRLPRREAAHPGLPHL